MSKFLVNLFLVFGGFGALAGCAHVAFEQQPPSNLDSEKLVYKTQTFIGSCAPRQESAIVAALASAAISQGITKIGEAIKSAAQTDTVTYSSSQNLEISQGAKFGPCITVIRGWFYRDAPDLSTRNTVQFSSNDSSAWPYGRGAVGDFWQHGMAIASTPDLYFRGLIVVSGDKSMYAIQPLEATLDKPYATTQLRPSGERYVTISFAIDKNVVDVKKSPGATLIIGKIRPGQEAKFSKQKCTYEDNENPVDCNAPNSFIIYNAEISNWFSVPIDKSLKPMQIQTLVTETRDASKFLDFVGGVLSDSTVKGALASTAQEVVLSSVRQSAEDSEKSSQRKADNDFDKAWQEARTALQLCIKEPANVNARLGARSALRSAISAAVNASDTYTQPFRASDAQAAAIQPNASSAAACQQALDLI
ncbi:hypothetical protein [Achromobacter denitrificans]|uniref:hypothetical protein n=1 Tax=Achromobacter denitrificans TaxID=32002 RepID=UPI0012FADCC6|nr:hypothetical protein [Achromobacter denitrificans]